MTQQFLLERHYISRDVDRQTAGRVREVGHLLSAVFEGPPPAPDLDRLIEQLPTQR